MIQNKQTLLGLLVVALLGVAAAPFLLRAEDAEQTKRRQRIATMSRAEREHLERNFARFEALDPAQRAQLQEFHAALEQDRATNHGRLTRTLQTYDQWLQTITPHQREALRKQQDPLQRLALLRETIEQQRSDRVENRMGERAEFLGPIPPIPRSDLEAMLEVISGKLGLYLTNPQELEGYEGMPRYLKMFELLARQRRSIRDLLSESNRQQLLEAVTDESTRAQLESLPEGHRRIPDEQLRRLKLGLALFQAVESELDRELRSRRVSPENLQAYFSSLPRPEQDELLSLTPGRFRQELQSQYVEKDWSQNRINMRLVRQFFRPQRPPAERSPAAPRRRDPAAADD